VLRARNCPPPTGQHEVVRDADGVPIAEPDLVWSGKILVFVDGDPHRWEHIKNHDKSQRQRLKGLGYKVVAVDMDDPEPGYADLLGRLGVAQPAVALEGLGGVTVAEPPSRPPAEREPLPLVPLKARAEVTPYDGWVPFYELSTGKEPGADDAEAGWLACPGLPAEAGWYAIQVVGRSMEPQIERGAVVVIEPLDAVAPAEGETVLVNLGSRSDPDTGTPFALRAWWPSRDADEAVSGLSLKGRPGSNVDPLEIDDLGSVQPLGRYVAALEME
jgi:hypothetical protein